MTGMQYTNSDEAIEYLREQLCLATELTRKLMQRVDSIQPARLACDTGPAGPALHLANLEKDYLNGLSREIMKLLPEKRVFVRAPGAPDAPDASGASGAIATAETSAASNDRVPQATGKPILRVIEGGLGKDQP